MRLLALAALVLYVVAWGLCPWFGSEGPGSGHRGSFNFGVIPFGFIGLLMAASLLLHRSTGPDSVKLLTGFWLLGALLGVAFALYVRKQGGDYYKFLGMKQCMVAYGLLVATYVLFIMGNAGSWIGPAYASKEDMQDRAVRRKVVSR